MSDLPRPRRSRLPRIIGIVVAIIIVLPLIAAGVLYATFNPNAYKPQIEAAVKNATGRDLSLNGPLSLRFTPGPALRAQDVAFANIAGAAQPRMATLADVSANLALGPLLHGAVVITNLTLVKPDILLQRDAQGRANWVFTPATPSAPLPKSTPAPSSPGHAAALSIQEIRIEDGTIRYQDAKTKQSVTVAVSKLDVTEPSNAAPIQFNLAGTVQSVPVTASGELGPLNRLMGASEGPPWPVRVALKAADATLNVDGTIKDPLKGTGYAAKVSAKAPNLATLAPLAPGVSLPPLHDVAVDAQVADLGAGTIPDISNLVLHVGKSQVNAQADIVALDVKAPGRDKPVNAALNAIWRKTPVQVTATLGAPASLLASTPGHPYPIDVSLKAADATLSAKGGLVSPIATPRFDGAIQAHVPDLATLGPLAGGALPALKALDLRGQVNATPQSIAVRNLALAMPPGTITGEATVALGHPASIRATLASSRLDLDALRAVLQSKPAPAAPAPAAPRPAVGSSGHVIPDTKLPFTALRNGNADIQLKITELHGGGEVWHDVAAHAVLNGGNLRVAPLTARLPNGNLNVTLAVDAAKQPAHSALTVEAPALPISTVLTLLGRSPDEAHGNLQTDIAVSGSGDTPHEIAATMDGHVGLSMVNGVIDNNVFEAPIAKMMRGANLPVNLAEPGRSDVRCFGTRIDISHGEANVRAFLLDTARLNLFATGTADLGRELWNISMRPTVHVGGPGVILPVSVRGTFADPHATLGAADAATAAAEVANRLFGKRAGIPAPAATGDECPRVLALARGGKAGPEAAPAPAAAKQEKGVKLKNLLHDFLR